MTGRKSRVCGPEEFALRIEVRALQNTDDSDVPPELYFPAEPLTTNAEG
jgi:hypothetical protein